MLKNLLFSLILFSISSVSFGQAQFDISVENYETDTLILGYYLADKMLVKDSLVRSSETGTFSFQQDSSLESGMYMLVSVPEGLFYQVLVPEDDQDFDITIDTTRDYQITFEGSDENALFYDYLNFIEKARLENERLEKVISETDSVLVSVRDQLRKDQEAINQIVGQKQLQVIEEFPNSIVALLIRSNLPFNFPEFSGTPEEVQDQRYRYYKTRYFDNLDLTHAAVLRTPIIDQRVTYFLESLTPINADSVIRSVDFLLDLMDPSSDVYRYYLSTLLNKYGNSKYIGLDAVYVHLALNYYGMDKAPWVTEENKKEIITNAKRIEPILIGKQAPDFTIQKDDGTPLALAELNNDYTVLVFWKPDCSHCTKAMPHILDFNTKWKDRGVEVIAICTASGKDYGECWEGVKSKGMEGLVNAGDQYRRSGIFSKYYTTSTPKIFVLDKNKKIKMKKVPAENLDAVMEQLVKLDASKEQGQ